MEFRFKPLRYSWPRKLREVERNRVVKQHDGRKAAGRDFPDDAPKIVVPDIQIDARFRHIARKENAQVGCSRRIARQPAHGTLSRAQAPLPPRLEPGEKIEGLVLTVEHANEGGAALGADQVLAATDPAEKP